MKYKNFFWGVVLILLGVLYLLKQMDVIYFNWRDILSLWPLVLVLWGISLLPIKSLYKLIASLASVLIMVVIIYNSPSRWDRGWIWMGDWHRGDRIELNESESRNEFAETAKLELTAAAGSYVIDGTSEELVDFTHIGDSGTYYMSTSSEGKRQYVRIGPENSNNQIANYHSHQVDIKLNPDLVWDLEIDAGAADLDLDLTPFIIDDMRINGGATSIEIKFGSLADDVNVKIETGVSSVLIKVPKDVACEVNTDTFLVSRELPGFNKVSKGTYVSPNFSEASKNITIQFNSGISSLRVLRY